MLLWSAKGQPLPKYEDEEEEPMQSKLQPLVQPLQDDLQHATAAPTQVEGVLAASERKISVLPLWALAWD